MKLSSIISKLLIDNAIKTFDDWTFNLKVNVVNSQTLQQKILGLGDWTAFDTPQQWENVIKSILEEYETC